MKSIVERYHIRAGIMATALLFGSYAFGQIIVSGPMVVAGYFKGSANITAGGSILVNSGGNWDFNGNITSADKGNANAPTASGRTETITFDGTGIYTNASGYIVDGYAAASNQASAFILPVGSGTVLYPVTVPAGVAVTAAYFVGSGSTQSTAVTGHTGPTTTEYSPYIDMPAGFAAGSYTFSYPAGFGTSNSSLLSSGNTSSNGTNNSTTYGLLATVANFSNTAGNTTATLPTTGISQVYFANSSTTLPVVLVSFKALANSCAANLTWQTSTESNSSYYGVEYASDGVTFSQMAKVASKNGASGATYGYTYPLNSGNNYFRLKLVENNGSFAYSQVLAVTGNSTCTVSGPIKVSPNPAHNVINIQGLETGNQILLLDLNSKKLIDLTASGNSQAIDISSFPKGVYLLRVANAKGNISAIKVVKQ